MRPLFLARNARGPEFQTRTVCIRARSSFVRSYRNFLGFRPRTSDCLLKFQHGRHERQNIHPVLIDTRTPCCCCCLFLFCRVEFRVAFLYSIAFYLFFCSHRIFKGTERKIRFGGNCSEGQEWLQIFRLKCDE